MHELLRATLVELTDALRNQEASPVELMEAVLARIDETNPDLNAVVAMYDREQLLREARKAETRIQRGEARPLEGIPLGVKDLEDARGLITSQGSLPFKDNVAKQDSTQPTRRISATLRSRRTSSTA
jgi:Asp-tRNA(Asn)/Glu-tRNA(Gln) amidotransferase A subunit family amidase